MLNTFFLNYIGTKLCGAVLMLSLSVPAFALVEIPFWHAMEAELGKEVDGLAQRFNQSQTEYRVIPVYKGDYEQTLAVGIAAFRVGKAPAILQVYEVGTATMMQAKQAIKPVWEVLQDSGLVVDESEYVPTIASYYADNASGRLLSQPFNSSTPVLYYNKDAFIKAGLDPETPPKTWQQLGEYAAKLRASGMSCGYASGWLTWIQLENFSAWNGLPYATENNGFGGAAARLQFNQPLQVKHIEFLNEMLKKGDFSYVGRKDEASAKFYNGDCGLMTGSSGSLANIKQYARFNYGVAFMPYDDQAPLAPQNAIIGGASLWIMNGQSPEIYRGVAAFFQFLVRLDNAAQWHQKTGYLPVTQAAYELTEQQGFYQKNPGFDTAIRQMLNKAPLPYTMGVRLGNMSQIRTVVDEELEGVWGGKVSAQQALDQAVSRGNQLLERFEKSTQ